MKQNELRGSKSEQEIVVLLHGIRTHAAWAEMVAEVLQRDGTIKAIPIRYGYFDVFRFLCPILTRRAPINRVVEILNDVRAEHPTANISVIAHSFGTYALVKALHERQIRLHRVILCGCIVRSDFRRAEYGGQLGRDPILNDCGTHDIWPVIAQSVTWGYGATGTFGFGTVGVRDRFSKFSHGEYFDKTFVEQYWLPFIQSGEIRPTPWETVRTPNSPWWVNLLSWLPLRYILAVQILVLIFLIPSCWSDKLSLRFGPNIEIGHVLGVPALDATFQVHNGTLTTARLTSIEVELVAPNGKEIPMAMESTLSVGHQKIPPLLLLLPSSGETINVEYTFFNYSPAYNFLYAEVQSFIGRNSIPGGPDETVDIIPETLANRLVSLARSEFIWQAGVWHINVTALNGRSQVGDSRTFTLSSEEVLAMWNVTSHYRSGIGVFPLWQRYALGDYRPFVTKRLGPPNL